MSKKTIHAVFENGIFRPLKPVDLPDKVEVEVEVEPRVVEKSDGWPEGYFEATAGAFGNEAFSRGDQGSLPDRGHW